jgi:dolichol-phosphate mannosyltransferase
MKLSVVIPVYNEVDSLQALHSELCEVARASGYALEIQFIDDGSSDGSWDAIQRLAAMDPQVHGIRFRRNFGKAAALSAGFASAAGDIVLTLDADLQDDPREIPRLLAELEHGMDVISGWKRVRHDPWHKVLPSRVFNWLVGILTGVRLHDHNCGFKCYRRQVLSELRLYGELHRFVPVLAAARGWKVGEIVVNHRPRQSGQSKYGVKRFVTGFLDLLTVYFLTSFGQRPQHLLGSLGLLGFCAGTTGVLVLSLWWLYSRLDDNPVNDVHLHQRAAFYYSMGAALLGTQFLSVGLLAELFTAFARHDELPYSVREYAGNHTDAHGDGRPGGPASPLHPTAEGSQKP